MDMHLIWQCIRLKAAWGVSSRNGCAQKCTNACIQASLLQLGSLPVSPTPHKYWISSNTNLQFFKKFNFSLFSYNPLQKYMLVERQAVLFWQLDGRSRFIVAFTRRCINTSNCLSLPPLYTTLYFTLTLSDKLCVRTAWKCMFIYTAPFKHRGNSESFIWEEEMP